MFYMFYSFSFIWYILNVAMLWSVYVSKRAQCGEEEHGG